ncbi:general substrate transporter [Microdochium trichocladiopsis]|uniref:General substrate transporter n=1 Tax=Microdochium trichocladiopsis TaxID=1682393 RepID=A0A9P9BP40_9PEZI|nr:general substrate transporter [Microdochium trichocladiopsis]KAH7028857.1 general substrate transporter [Microdochium trichocladiopsis]
MTQAHEKSSDAAAPKYWGVTGKKVQKLVTAVATTDFLLFGYDQGVMSGIISAPAFQHSFPEVEGDSTYEGFVVSIYAVGCFLGALFILMFGDHLGRRKSIFLGGMVMIVGVIIQVTAFGPSSGATAQFIIGRCITGIGNGINTSTVPTYQAECSESHNRGKLICIEGGNVAIGTLIAYWIDYGCTYGPEAFVWRFPIAFQCVFAMVVLVLMTRLPESPRWLLTKGRTEEAAVVLAGLAGMAPNSAVITEEVQVIEEAIRASGHKGGITPFSALFEGGPMQSFRRMVLGASSQMMQQLSGCNAVIYYFPILFQTSIGTSHNLALLLGGVNMVVYSIFATTSWFAVERIGRRKLFLIGTVGQCLSMVLTFGALLPGTPEAAKGAAVGLFTYIAFFGATWLPLPWLYPAEINPLRTRAKANATSTVQNWLWNFFVVMVTPVMLSGTGTSGWGTYLFFAVMNAMFFPIIYFLYPETAGRSLEEIDLIFAKGFTEKISYVKAAQDLPKLGAQEVQRRAKDYGLGVEEEIKTDHAEREIGMLTDSSS